MKQLRRVLTLFISLCALLLVLPGAHAHVSVISTSPQYQSTIAKLPVEIVIEFNSPLLTLGTKNPKTIELINPSGLSITVGQARVEGSRVSMAKGNSVAGNDEAVEQCSLPVEPCFSYNSPLPASSGGM